MTLKQEMLKWVMLNIVDMQTALIWSLHVIYVIHVNITSISQCMNYGQLLYTN